MPQITLVPTGQRFDCEPHETVLAAALRAGLNLPHSCKGGHCASCRARVLTGRVEYPEQRLPAGITSAEADERYALLCQVRPVGDVTVETRDIRPAPDVEIRNLPCRIDRMERLASDVMAVFLRMPVVEELHYRAGQYLDFLLPGGRRRSFSIASAPADGRALEVHVRRASAQGFTGQLFDSMKAGALLRIEAPLGQFWFHGESPRPPVMIGGGTGYAPLRAMLRQMFATGDRRQVTLYWGARTRLDLYEHTWLENLALVHPGFTYRPVLSAVEPASDGPAWAGRTGLVHEVAFAEVGHLLPDCDVYASGRPAMIEAIRQAFVARRLPREQLYFDSFDYAPDTLEAMRKAGSGSPS